MLCIKMYNSYLHPLVPRLLPAGMEGLAPVWPLAGEGGWRVTSNALPLSRAGAERRRFTTTSVNSICVEQF